MSVYDLHYNKDDEPIRNIIVGLLATLHDNVKWENQIGNKIHEKREIKIPFYWSTTGQERYLQDNFLNNIDFDPENLEAEAVYNTIPRGVVELTGMDIEGSNIVNKYIRMEQIKQELDGTLNTYNTECFMLPLLLTFDITVYTDSNLDMLKCTTSIIKTFFKNKVFQVDISFTRIPCVAVFPDSYDNERGIEFSFNDKKEYITKFALNVQTHMPIFKEETSIFAGNRIETFENTIFIPPLTAGSTNMTTNTNLAKNTGQVGATYNAEDQLPSWPISPDTKDIPKGGSYSKQ